MPLDVAILKVENGMRKTWQVSLFYSKTRCHPELLQLTVYSTTPDDNTMGLRYHKSSKNQERFTTIGNSWSYLSTVPNELPSAVLVNLPESTIFSVHDL